MTPEQLKQLEDDLWSAADNLRAIFRGNGTSSRWYVYDG